jgi:hypothetical protein
VEDTGFTQGRAALPRSDDLSVIQYKARMAPTEARKAGEDIMQRKPARQCIVDAKLWPQVMIAANSFFLPSFKCSTSTHLQQLYASDPTHKSGLRLRVAPIMHACAKSNHLSSRHVDRSTTNLSNPASRHLARQIWPRFSSPTSSLRPSLAMHKTLDAGEVPSPVPRTTLKPSRVAPERT